MEKYSIEKSTLVGIADAIRQKKGITDPIPVPQMKQEIEAIPVGLDTSDATVTENAMPMGVTGYARGEKVTGNVEVVSGHNELTDAIPQWDDSKGTFGVGFYAQNRVFFEENADVTLYVKPDKLGDATDADVAEGKTYTSENGLKRTGTKQAPVEVAQATPTITVDSNGLITAKSVQGAGLVSSGTKQATKQLDTMQAYEWTPTTYSIGIPAGQYLTGAQTIKGDANLIPENIKYGTSIFGVPGSFAGGGACLPTGVIALASGTYTPTQNYSARADVPHGMGVKPNFCIVMMEQDLSDAVLTSALVGASVFYKPTKYNASSSILYTAHIMMEGYGSSGQMTGSASRAATESYFTDTTFGIPCNSTYQMISGQTYHWICGLLDGVL